MMGDVVLRGKLPYPMFMEFSWLMELQRAWGFFVLTMRNFLSSTLWVPDWEFFGTGQKCHASSTLNKLTREHGGEKQS
jgi:hypothetical protein